MIGQYELHGRQIFDMSSGLVEVLQKTDIHDCTLRNLQLPYPALHLHFGRQAELRVVGANGEPEYIDGVLVAHAVGNGLQLLRFATTTIDASGNRVTLPGHFLSLSESDVKLPVHVAIEAAVKRFVGDAESSVPEFPWAGGLLGQSPSAGGRCADDGLAADRERPLLSRESPASAPDAPGIWHAVRDGRPIGAHAF